MKAEIYVGLFTKHRNSFRKNKHRQGSPDLIEILKKVEEYFGCVIVEPEYRARKKQKHRELFYYFCFELLYDKIGKTEKTKFFREIGKLVHRNRATIFHNFKLWEEKQFLNDYCHFNNNFFRNHYYILKGMFDGDDYTDCLINYRP